MRILCLTFGDRAQASSFFRIYQYVEPLKSLGIHLEPVPARKFTGWGTVAAYDAVLVQKALLPVGNVRRLRLLTRRLLYDIDDAIWHPQGREHFFLTNLRQNLRLKTITRSADLCLAANGVIASHLKRWTPRVAVLPMALDEDQWSIRNPQTIEGKVRIGWSGSPVNLRYLEAIEPALAEVQTRYEVEFAIFCGQAPQFRRLKFVHVPFVAGREAEVIRTFDIGLLPLPDNDFAAGKSPIKGLQYMASEAATVLSPVGAAEEMFAEGQTALFARNNQQWSQGLSRLIEDAALRRSLAENAHAVFLKKFSLTSNLSRVAAALTGSGELLP